MNPKKKLQKHHLTEEDKWLSNNYNPERDGYNGWLLEIPTDERIVVVSVSCERPNLYLESMARPSFFEPETGQIARAYLSRTGDMYFEVLETVTNGFEEVLRHFVSNERRGPITFGYKKNMTLIRYVHGVMSERYHLLGCVINEVRFPNLHEEDNLGGCSFTLNYDHYTFISL